MFLVQNHQAKDCIIFSSGSRTIIIIANLMIMQLSLDNDILP